MKWYLCDSPKIWKRKHIIWLDEKVRMVWKTRKWHAYRSMIVTSTKITTRCSQFTKHGKEIGRGWRVKRNAPIDTIECLKVNASIWSHNEPSRIAWIVSIFLLWQLDCCCCFLSHFCFLYYRRPSSVVVRISWKWNHKNWNEKKSKKRCVCWALSVPSLVMTDE